MKRGGKKGSVSMLPVALLQETAPESPESISTTGDLAETQFVLVAAPPEQFQTAYGTLQPTEIQVNTAVAKQGIEINMAQGELQKSFAVSFPSEIWNALPKRVKPFFRDHLAYLSTIELAMTANLRKISYNTPLPLFKPYFTELMLRCALSSGDADDRTTEYVQRLCNVRCSFSPGASGGQLIWSAEERSVNTITFGKESLVSLGLAWELGLDPVLMTSVESDWNFYDGKKFLRTYENKHKLRLVDKFEKEFSKKVYTVQNGFENLRFFKHWNLENTDLGWSSQLTEYMFFMLPFAYYHRCKYMLYGHEQSCDSSYYNKEGFKCNPVYDQSSEWIQHQNAMLQNLTAGSMQAVSLVQPIHEIAICRILYQRYPYLAKYQMSCHADNEGSVETRWCQQCSKCARIFVFMKALGFDPASVGFTKDMFRKENKKHFPLFDVSKEMRGFDSCGLSRNEQMFAFFLVAERGVQGELVDLFKKKYYDEARKREAEFRAEFFSVHEPKNIPEHLWEKLKPILEKELEE
ncbi:hypothetical protein HYX14_02895 [Candidatus Woesearchaeota archaeon]|nr:hypothetical protein [Candidatus Woesearchaeota archaeon]